MSYTHIIKSLSAAVMLFTRIPLWRCVRVDKEHYADALLYWPLIGFLTGVTTWIVFWTMSEILPLLPACVLAVLARLLLTGALHEDGLADFFDGFGGGRDKNSILRIMKDSHIGTYGILGLIAYFLLYVSILHSFYTSHLAGIIIGADVCSKLCTAVMINSLPYARSEEESKVKVLYRQIHLYEFAIVAVFCFAVLWLLQTPFLALIPSLLIIIGMRQYLRYKIGGYTGDCCGATVLMAELFFYLGALFLDTNFL